MPSRLPRTLVITALVVVVAVVAVVFVGSRSGGYRVHMIVQDAGQLVKGNLVQVGGVTIGKVSDIQLSDNNLADVELHITDGDYDPLHKGTKATIRSTSLSAVAGRVVSIAPGPNSSGKIGDGGDIPYQDSQPIVDLDEVLNSIDMQTRSDLQGVVHGSAALYAKDTQYANRGLAALNPALSQTKGLVDQLLSDRRTFEQFLVQSAGVVSAVAGRDADLEGGLRDAASAAQAVAGQRQALEETLRRSPATLRRANTTLVNLRAALTDLRPALRDAQPAAPRLAKVLKVAAPLTRRAKPVVAQTTAMLPALTSALKDLPAVDKSARPAFSASIDAVTGTLPIVAALRPYLPDVFGGLLAGFGGSEGGYYDANGHYARISAQVSQLGLEGALSALVPPQGDGSDFNGYRTHLFKRCPGAATQAAPDGSNPYQPDSVSFCSLADSPK